MIRNLRSGGVLAARSRRVEGILGKAIGLMFHAPIRDFGMVFLFSRPRRVDLHMLFVFFPIDVLFLDRAGKVVELKERLLPFAFYLSRVPAAAVIELPAGSLRRDGTRLGDHIAF